MFANDQEFLQYLRVHLDMQSQVRIVCDSSYIEQHSEDDHHDLIAMFGGDQIMIATTNCVLAELNIAVESAFGGIRSPRFVKARIRCDCPPNVTADDCIQSTVSSLILGQPFILATRNAKVSTYIQEVVGMPVLTVVGETKIIPMMTRAVKNSFDVMVIWSHLALRKGLINLHWRQPDWTNLWN